MRIGQRPTNTLHTNVQPGMFHHKWIGYSLISEKLKKKYREKPTPNPVKPKPPVIVPKKVYTGAINDMMDLFTNAGIKFKEK